MLGETNIYSYTALVQVDEMAEKLDGMMCLMFHHLQHRSKGPEQQRTWVAMLNTFFSTIINTHRSKFIQYLVWYLMDLVSPNVWHFREWICSGLKVANASLSSIMRNSLSGKNEGQVLTVESLP